MGLNTVGLNIVSLNIVGLNTEGYNTGSIYTNKHKVADNFKTILRKFNVTLSNELMPIDIVKH